jgi:type IV pilus assembly protein PilX
MNGFMHQPRSYPAREQRSRQRGVVLIFTLIVLLILTIGAVALMRSMNSSLFSAGNLAFRRDLVNQGEQAVSYVMTEFKPGPLGILSSPTASQSDLLTANYSSVILPANREGVPNVLLDDVAFTAQFTGPDIAGAPSSGVTIRYVIDRLCSVTGIPSSALCVQSSALPTGGTHNRNTAVPPPSATVYRLSVRVSGPRSTQVFLQTTFTKPD